MNDTEVLAALHEAAQTLGFCVRYEKLDDDEISIGSGACRVGGERLLIIDQRLNDRERWRALQRELRAIDTESVYLSPLARRLLESAEE